MARASIGVRINNIVLAVLVIWFTVEVEVLQLLFGKVFNNGFQFGFRKMDCHGGNIAGIHIVPNGVHDSGITGDNRAVCHGVSLALTNILIHRCVTIDRLVEQMQQIQFVTLIRSLNKYRIVTKIINELRIAIEIRELLSGNT